VDVSILVTTYGKSAGDLGFDSRADFNDDGVVDAADFSLLASNYNRSGSLACPAAGASVGAATAPSGSARQDVETFAGNPVVLALMPQAQQGAAGDVVTIDLMLDTGSQPINNVELYLTFEPTVLQLVDADGHPAASVMPDASRLDSVLLNQASNDSGTIRYDAMQPLGGASPSGTFRIATVHFKVLNGAYLARVRYVEGSAAFYEGDYLPVRLGSASVEPRSRIYLPAVLR
jgi:hypothetical protein